MGHRRQCLMCAAILFLILPTACTMSPSPSPPTSTPTLPPIRLSAPDASLTLCAAATQFRLALPTPPAWPEGQTAHWTLSGESGPLTQGNWSPQEGDLLIPFPDGRPLPPGTYTLQLRLGETPLLHHTIRISDIPARLKDLALAPAPVGPTIPHLAAGTRHFYLRYTYEGACTGAPLWAVVQRDDGATICSRSVTLTTAKGEDAIACYLPDGGPLPSGRYRADLSLMGTVTRSLTFEVKAPPTPTPTATPTPLPPPTPTPTPMLPHCGPLFTAAGITPDGEPYLPGDRFEWYTQALYAGSRCRSLPDGTHWESLWFRNGEPVRRGSGTWHGPTTGVIWDTLTGTPRNPFLYPGTYTVTLRIGSHPPLSAQFRLVPYVRPTPSGGD